MNMAVHAGYSSIPTETELVRSFQASCLDYVCFTEMRNKKRSCPYKVEGLNQPWEAVFWPPQAPFTMHQALCICACSLFVALFPLHTKLKNCKMSHLFDDESILLKVKLWSNEIPLHLLRKFEIFWANANKTHLTKDERCS